MSDRNYYVLCEDNCKFPAMTKEQILSAIAEATGITPSGADSAFITKIREKNAAKNLSFWVGTQAEYNALAVKEADCFYVITDDTTGRDLSAAIQEVQARCASIEENAIKESERLDQTTEWALRGYMRDYGEWHTEFEGTDDGGNIALADKNVAQMCERLWVTLKHADGEFMKVQLVRTDNAPIHTAAGNTSAEFSGCAMRNSKAVFAYLLVYGAENTAQFVHGRVIREFDFSTDTSKTGAYLITKIEALYK